MTDFAGLRIGLIGPLPPGGGMAQQTQQLAELLRGENAEVLLVPTNAPYRPAAIGRIPGLRAALRLLPYLWALWRAVGRCDLVHIMANSGWSWHLFAAPAIWIAWLRGVPAIVNYRGGEAAAFLLRSATAVRMTMDRVTLLVVPSGFLQQVFERHGMASQVLPNIVDATRFRPQAAMREPIPHLVVTRHLEPIYDNATALRAFAEVRRRWPRARLTVAGRGIEAGRLQALAHELGLGDSVRFAGGLDRDGIAALLRDADVSLNPSLADNMPNSVLESLASGIPVVSTDVGGVPFVVRDGVTALLVPPGDPRAMAVAVLRLLDDRALASRLRDSGLVETRRHTWSCIAPLLAAQYQGALPRRRNRLA